MNNLNDKFVAAVISAIVLTGGLIGGFAILPTMTATAQEDTDVEDPVTDSTEEVVLETHNAIMASLDATEDVSDEFNSRWTSPGTVEGDDGLAVFIVDCLPGEYPATPQFIGLNEDVQVIQQYVIGSGSDYLSMLYLVANFGDNDQVVKMGVTCIDEEGAESGDNDNDDEGDITRITNNNFITNIINNIVNNINKNITIINNSTNGTVITPPPDDNGTGGNTTDPGTGGNTTDPGTGGNTTDPGTGGNTTEPIAPIESIEDPGLEETQPAVENTTTPSAPVEEEETETTAPVEEDTATTPPVTEEETTTPPTEEETTTPPVEEEVVEEENTQTAEELENAEETSTETDNNDNTPDAT